MKKSIICTLCVVLLLCSCGLQKEVSQESKQNTTQETQMPTTSKSRVSMEEIQKVLNETTQNGYVTWTGQGKDSLSFLWYQDNTHYLGRLDVTTGECIQKKVPAIKGRKVVVKQVGEYVIVSNDKKTFVLFDKDMKAQECTLPKNVYENGRGTFCVLPKKKKIVYAQDKLKEGTIYTQVVACDYKGKNQHKMCEIEFSETGEKTLCDIVDIMPSEDEDTLYYTGLYPNPKDPTECNMPCIGKMDYATGKLVTQFEGKLEAKIMSKGALYTDGLLEKGKKASGYLIQMNEKGEAKRLSVKKDKESQQAVSSDNGTYYISYISDDEYKTTEICCYSFEDCKYQWGQKVEHNINDIWYYEDYDMLVSTYFEQDGMCKFEVKSSQEKDTEKVAEAEENPFDIEEIEKSGVNVVASYSFGVSNYDDNTSIVPYDGGELHVDFLVETEKYHFPCSVLIYIDGILQPYALTSQGEKKEQHAIEVKGQDTTISAYFVPQVDGTKKEHRLHFLCMYEPDKEYEKGNISLGNSHKISQLLSWKLDVKGQVQTLNKSVPREKAKTQKLEQDTEFTIDIQPGKAEKEATYQIASTVRGNYRLSAYVGHKLVKLSKDSPYLDVSFDKNTVYKGKIQLDGMTDKEYDSLYIMAVPLDCFGTLMVSKSDSVCLYQGGVCRATD